MKRQCPNCESMDVQLNEKGQLVCFTCFNIFSSDNLNKSVSSKELPPFPEELERKMTKRKGSRTGSDSSDSTTYKRVIS